MLQYFLEQSKMVWKQFISIEYNSTNKVTVICGITRRKSILGPLLFLLYANNLYRTLKVLNPIMYADNTNIFFSYSGINVLFGKIKEEITNITNWFNINKLLLNVKNMKYSFFQKG